MTMKQSDASCVSHTIPKPSGIPTHTRTQAEINRSIVDILDQLAQEIRRIRDGKSLSNLTGVEHEIRKLVAYLRQTEGVSAVELNIR